MVKQARGLKPVFLAMTMVVPLAVLPGCAAVYDPAGFSAAITQSDGQRAADAALAALARGDYAEAEGHVTLALGRDPQNPYALLAAGVLYHNTGRPTRARQMYEEILATNTLAQVSGPWWGSQPRPVVDVAAESLRALGSAGLSGTSHSGTSLSGPMGDAALSPSLPTPGLEGPEEQRFAVLQRLRSEGLITAEEYSRRRAANLGALLPLSEQPPAQGLSGAVPLAEQVVSRLRALREAYETRNLTAAQHAAERTAILDGLLPAAPRNRVLAALPPSDVMGAAAMIGRLQRLREAGLITEAEMTRERAAIERAMRSGGSGAAVRTSAPETAAAPPTPQPKPEGAAAAPSSGLVVASSANPAATLRTGRTPLEVVASPAPAQTGSEAEGQAGAEAEAEEEMTDAAVLSGRVAPAPLLPPTQPPAEAEAEAAETAAVPPAARGEASDAGPVFVHLASFRSPQGARQGWADLQRRYPALQQLSLQVTEVDLSGRGVFHRVNAGPLANRAAAEALCLQLRGQYCRPMFPNGQ